MKPLIKLQGKLTWRLFFLFILLGIVPTLAFTVFPSIYQLNATNRATEQASAQLERKAENNLVELATSTAQRYSLIFEDKARIATILAERTATAMAESDFYEDYPGWEVYTYTRNYSGGWRAAGDENSAGLLISPYMPSSHDALLRQRAISSVIPLAHAITQNDPLIRTTVIVTEDQTLWLYPNYLREEPQNIISSNPDLTQRPYYQRTRDVVWSKPYVDMEPVITVAAPIWIGDEFVGMAGVDFSLAAIVEELLKAEVGTNGFMFLIGEGSQLIAFPERACEAFDCSTTNNVLDASLEQTLCDVVDDDLCEQLAALGLNEDFSDGVSHLSRINLPDGPAYFAVAPIPELPWQLVIVQPVADVTQIVVEQAETIRVATKAMLLQSIVTGLGFLFVVLSGGVVTLQQLALPIQDLATGANALAQGDLSYRVPVGDHEDEMATLARSFNSMAEALQDARNEEERQKEKLAQSLSEREDEFDAINTIAALAISQTELPRNLSRALKIANDILEYDIAAVLLLDQSGALSVSTIVNSNVFQEPITALSTECFAHGLCRQALHTRQIMSVSDIEAPDSNLTHDLRRLYSSLGIGSTMIVPIVIKGKSLGIMHLMRKTKGALPEGKYIFLEALTKHLAMLVENSQLQNQMRDFSIMEERQRLARELHDSVTQSLFTLRLAASGIKAGLDENNQINTKALDLLIEQIQVVQNTMRSLITELRPVDLQEESLEAALEKHVNSLRRFTDVDATLKVTGDLEKLPLRVQQYLNRIAQEALSNISRHAQAENAQIALDVKEDVVILTVQDDGLGFDPTLVTRSEAGSLGLLSMRERAEILSGALFVRSQPDKGTVITAKIPLKDSRMETHNE